MQWKKIWKGCRKLINTLQDPNGKYIAFSKYENANSRFENQIQFLDKHPKYVGCGTFINLDKNSFFYSQDPNIIEKELLEGKIIIEQSTFLFRNCLKDYKNIEYFNLLCSLLYYGIYTNISAPLVKINEYKVIKNTDFTNRIKIAKSYYSKIINVVHINITSDGNFSGVDRYIKTLEDNYPSYVRCQRVTFRASNDKLSFDLSDPDHVIIYYNVNKTKLEHLYDTIWDNISYMFNKRNLIVQSNCFNLYTFLTYLY